MTPGKAMTAPGSARKSSVSRLMLGWVCVLLGLVGLLLPLLPGIPLLFVGVVLLARQYRWARLVSEWARSIFRRRRATVAHVSAQLPVRPAQDKRSYMRGRS